MKDKYLLITLATLFIAFLPYLILAFFTVPSSDDFFQAHYSSEYGIFGYVKWRYLSYNGRYAADFLVALYNSLGHKVSDLFLYRYYSTVPLILMVFYVFTGGLSSFLLLGERRFIAILIYGLIAVISALGHVEIRSTFFWLAGGIAYSLANALFIALISTMIHYLYIKPKRWVLIASLVLIPFINGLSEVVMASCTAFVLGISCLDTLLRRNKAKLILEKLSWTLLAIASALIVYAAPGNYERSPGFDQVPINYVSLFWDTAIFTLSKAFHWINPFWIALVVAIILLSQSSPMRMKAENVFREKKALIPIFGSLALTFYVSYLIRFYVLWDYRPLRTDSVSYTVFYITAVFIGLCISFNVALFRSLSSKTIKKMLLASVVLTCCFSFVSGYSFYALFNDFKLLKAHHQYYQLNYAALIQGGAEDEVKLPPEPRVEVLRWKCYLTDDKEHWINQYVAKYFNVKSAVAVGNVQEDPGLSGKDGCGG